MTEQQRCQQAATAPACPEKGKRYRHAAIHEAGHALAYWWNGQHIEFAEARTGLYTDRRGREFEAAADLEGMVAGASFIASPAMTLQDRIGMDNPLFPEMVARDLLHCYAGPVAEAIHRHIGLMVALWVGGAGDMHTARQLLALLPEAERPEAERQAVARCRVLVRRYWPAVLALADLLQERGRVEGEDVESLLCAVTGESPKWRGNPLSDLDKRGARHA